MAKSLDTLHHRRPNDQRTQITADVSMGVTRLAVIDIKGGRQPDYNEHGSIAVVLNGEIYNHRELMRDLIANGHRFTTRSDTEVLIHLYEEHGAETVRYLHSMFAFAIHDARNRRLFLARDRFGKKPLFSRAQRDGLTFAAEIKALKPYARAAGERWTVSPQTVADYLSSGVVPQASTIYEGVFCILLAPTRRSAKVTSTSIVACHPRSARRRICHARLPNTRSVDSPASPFVRSVQRRPTRRLLVWRSRQQHCRLRGCAGDRFRSAVLHSLDRWRPRRIYFVAQMARQLGVQRARSVLPAGVTVGAKRGFEIPLSDWLVGNLRVMVRDLVGSPTPGFERWWMTHYSSPVRRHRLCRQEQGLPLVLELEQELKELV